MSDDVRYHLAAAFVVASFAAIVAGVLFFLTMGG